MTWGANARFGCYCALYACALCVVRVVHVARHVMTDVGISYHVDMYRQPLAPPLLPPLSPLGFFLRTSTHKLIKHPVRSTASCACHTADLPQCCAVREAQLA